MTERALILSLQIIAIFLLFQEGNALSPVRVRVANWLDSVVSKRTSAIIQKPLWECYPCMASVWTIVLTQRIEPGLILLVCGINYLLCKTIVQDED